MESLEIYNRRLLKYASALEKRHFGTKRVFVPIRIQHFTYEGEFEICLTCYRQLLDPLPVIFKEWYRDTLGLPRLIGSEPIDVWICGVIDYFGFEMEEFVHVFSMEGLQNPGRFGGVILRPESEVADIIKNIRALVKYRVVQTMGMR